MQRDKVGRNPVSLPTVRDCSAFFCATLAALALTACAGKKEALSVAEALETQTKTVRDDVKKLKERDDKLVDMVNGLAGYSNSLGAIAATSNLRFCEAAYNKKLSEVHAASASLSKDIALKLASAIDGAHAAVENRVAAPDVTMHMQLLIDHVARTGQISEGLSEGARGSAAQLATREAAIIRQLNFVSSIDAMSYDAQSKAQKVATGIARTAQTRLDAATQQKIKALDALKAKCDASATSANATLSTPIISKPLNKTTSYDALDKYLEAVEKSGQALKNQIESNDLFGDNGLVRAGLEQVLPGFVDGLLEKGMSVAAESDKQDLLGALKAAAQAAGVPNVLDEIRNFDISDLGRLAGVDNLLSRLGGAATSAIDSHFKAELPKAIDGAKKAGAERAKEIIGGE